MEAPTLEERVLRELLNLRKSRHGVTVESLSHAITIRDLLGAGDPYVAHSRFMHQILTSDLGTAIAAAAASLGFSSSGNTHLRRLDDFGSTAGLEQRQVRRYSDQGIRVLARLISTNWTTETVPQLSAIVNYLDRHWELRLSTRRLHVVEMSPPKVEIMVGSTTSVATIKWRILDRDRWQHAISEEAIVIADEGLATSVVIVWRGELWPKHNTAWVGTIPLAESESLGNKLMLRFRGPNSFDEDT